MTIVMSGSVAGAVMITFLAPAWRCFCASGRLRKRPLASMTMSIFILFPGELGRIGDRRNLDLLAIYDDPIVGCLDLGIKDPVDRVVFQQVC